MVTQHEEYTVECENVPNDPEGLRNPTMLPCRASYWAASTAGRVRADVTRLVQPCDVLPVQVRLPQVEVMAGQPQQSSVRKGCPAVEANVGRNDDVMKCFEAGEGEALGWDDRGKQRRAGGR